MRLLIASLLAVYALSAKAAPTIDTNFVVAFPCLSDTANLFLYITNANNTQAVLNITSSYPDFDPMQQIVDPNSTLQIQLYEADLQVCDSNNAVAQKGIFIQSSQPVSVYANMETSDGTQATNFLVLPVTVLGKQYAMNTDRDSNLNILVALQDNTQVTFSENSRTINLNRLEAVKVSRGGNMTSNNALAVIYSMSTGQNSAQYGTDAFMALPIVTKATEFPFVPHPNVTSTNVRVLAFEDHTYILINGLTQYHIDNAGDYLQIQMTAPCIITTSKKAQVLTGNYRTQNQVAAQVVSSTFYLTSRRFLFHTMTHVPSHSRDPAHNLVIITTQASTGGIALDGTTISALQYRRIPSSNYYYVTVPVSSDQHLITTNSSSVKYTASVYSTYSGAQYANAKFNIGLDLPPVTE